MHLTDEDRARGQRAFASATTSDVTHKELAKRGVNRRDFIKGAAATGAVAAVGLGGAYFGYSSIDKPLRVGIIGTGDEGNVLIGAINPNYVQVVAIADIRPYNIYRALHGDASSPNAAKVRPGLLKVYGWKSEDQARQNVKVYTDRYQELLENSDVEAVIIALPLHLHCKVAIEAIAAGKHVLTEKLMGHSVHECKEMGRVSYAQGKLLATGHQRHYSVLYENAVDLIKLGLIGDVHHIRAQWHREKDTWSPDLPDKIAATLENRRKELAQIEKEFSMLSGRSNQIKDELKASAKLIDSALKKRKDDLIKAIKTDEIKIQDGGVVAENYGYQKKSIQGRERSALEELIRWRIWQRTGGGLMAELGSHQLDASGIFISAAHGHKVRPLSVVANGGIHLYNAAEREAEDHVYCIYEYPGKDYYKDAEQKEVKDKDRKIVVTYSSINGNGYGGYGEVVMGTTGTLILEKEEEALLFGGSTKTDVSVAVKDNKPVLDTTQSGGPQTAQAATPKGDISKGYREEIEHFAWCIRNFDESDFKDKKDQYERLPRCHPKVAMADAIIALTTNLAIKSNRRIDFKPEWFDIASDETPENIKPDVERWKKPAEVKV
jgi:predicted dehydrogenase